MKVMAASNSSSILSLSQKPNNIMITNTRDIYYTSLSFAPALFAFEKKTRLLLSYKSWFSFDYDSIVSPFERSKEKKKTNVKV